MEIVGDEESAEKKKENQNFAVVKTEGNNVGFENSDLEKIESNNTFTNDGRPKS